MSNKNKDNYVAVGGQALMEGIMMRGPKGTAMSLRLPDGTIETQMKDFVSVRKKYKIRQELSRLCFSPITIFRIM